MVEFRFARFAPGMIPCRDRGPLAQLAERRADNAEVGGSSPPRPTPIRQAFHNANRSRQTPWPTTFSSRWFQRRRVRQSCCVQHAWRRRCDNIAPIADSNTEAAAGTGHAVQDAAAYVNSASPGSRTASRISAADLKAASVAVVANSEAQSACGAGHARVKRIRVVQAAVVQIGHLPCRRATGGFG